MCLFLYVSIHVHVYYACICVCIYGVYIWMYIFRHCVYKRAFILFWSYDHVHIEKEKKSSEKLKKYIKQTALNLQKCYEYKYEGRSRWAESHMIEPASDKSNSPFYISWFDLVNQTSTFMFSWEEYLVLD